METPEEFVGSNDHQIHRRNKRLRLLTSSSAVLPAAADATSSSSCGGGGDREYLAAASSSVSVSVSVSGDVSTEEEEDMANCLILLAQGGRPTTQQSLKIDRISSKRFNFETMAKSGFYVYECKTCNRTFPSFQALGGHRASHKKPKPMITAVAAPEEEVSELDPQLISNKIAAPVPAATKTVAAANSQAQKGGKVHECSICGLEFGSGQALGGHMRRHRATAAAVSSSSTSTHQQVVAMNSAVKGTTTTTTMKKQRNNILELDLNLPAPEEDLRETKFQFTATPQTIVFAAPTLVDCHY